MEFCDFYYVDFCDFYYVGFCDFYYVGFCDFYTGVKEYLHTVAYVTLWVGRGVGVDVGVGVGVDVGVGMISSIPVNGLMCWVMFFLSRFLRMLSIFFM